MLNMTKGMHWIGHPASLGWIVDRGEEGVEDDVRASEFTPLSGGRQVAVSLKRPARSWSFTIPQSHADEVAHIRTLLTALLPPFQLVTAHAQVSNVLTPERSTMGDIKSHPDGLPLGGSWPIEGGGHASIVRVNTAAMFGSVGQVLIGPAPVPPVWTGRQVTVSAHLATEREGGASVTLYWLSATGSIIEPPAHVGNSVTGMDALRRSTATGTPPPGAVACQIAVRYAEVIAQPQVTWTAAPILEWSVGEGADTVYIAGASRGTDMAIPDAYAMRRSGYSFQVREVTA